MEAQKRSNQHHVTGTVEEVLPSWLFSVRLNTGTVVVAGLDRSFRHQVVRLLKGEQVELRLSSENPGRGQITRKL